MLLKGHIGLGAPYLTLIAWEVLPSERNVLRQSAVIYHDTVSTNRRGGKV